MKQRPSRPSSGDARAPREEKDPEEQGPAGAAGPMVYEGALVGREASTRATRRARRAPPPAPPDGAVTTSAL